MYLGFLKSFDRSGFIRFPFRYVGFNTQKVYKLGIKKQVHMHQCLLPQYKKT